MYRRITYPCALTTKSLSHGPSTKPGSFPAVRSAAASDPARLLRRADYSLLHPTY
jgi:hypothetical protein